MIHFNRGIAPSLLLLVLPGLAAGELTDRNVHLRGSLNNSRIQFETEKTGHVAFMGGSITEMNGYRPLVCAWLQERFPGTKFTFTAAGISSTCSTTGAMRLQRDVLSKGPVDLFFVEFAVNDDQDAGHARRECIRGMEGIVRHVREHNPHADIVNVHFCNPGIVETFQKKNTPVSVGAHETVDEHHHVSSVNLAKEVAQQISEGTLTWKQFGGTHPGPQGNRLAADMASVLLEKAWQGELPKDASKKAHDDPDKPLDIASYARGRLVDPSQANADSWMWDVPNWKTLPGNCRTRFVKEKLLAADKPGSELTLEFTGRAIGAYVLAGPDAGTVEASIDGGEFQTIDLSHRYSRGLHYPRTVMFFGDLDDAKHTLRLRISDEKNTHSKGHAVRILKFAAN